MLLQTFVQLNILLLAAPALANWAALPFSPPLLVQAARVVLTPAAPAVEGRAAVAAAPRRAIARSFTIRERSDDAGPQAASAAPVPLLVSLCRPFPHAARAP